MLTTIARYRIHLLYGLLGLSLIFLFPPAVFPGEFRVTPIRLIFENQVKSGVIHIINEGEEPLQVQMKAFEWTQDARGKDVYNETKDLVFFPRIMTVKRDEDRIVRVGVKKTSVSREKTYRLFINEIPKPEPEKKGARINVSIRFGVPIFIKPSKEEVKGVIDQVKLGEGKFITNIRNTGNSHFRILSVLVKGSDANGEENFTEELNGWYLLAGAGRSYETSVPQEVCRDTARFDVEVKTDQFSLQKQMDVIKSLCLP